MRIPASLIVVLALVGSLAGCRAAARKQAEVVPVESHVRATQIEYPDVDRSHTADQQFALPPRTLDDSPPDEFWDLTYEQVLQIALSRSEVLRDLGLRVLNSPGAIPTVYDPAIRESDPLYGTEAALAEFDAQFSGSLLWSKNDRAVNNDILAGDVSPTDRVFELDQDLGAFRADVSKVAATGTRFSLRNLTQYDQSNQGGNVFASAWDTQFEFGVRHPLLQGSGVAFNRIAGPNAQPGFNFSSGVLVARANTDISLADFEQNVRDFVSQLEETYWDLYVAYRDLDAKVLARDSAFETWRIVQAKFAKKLRGGEADKEAQAREQYLLFQGLVQDALNGSQVGGTSVGIYRGERRLRRLMGLPGNDGRLIRPVDEPAASRVAYSWDESLAEAFARRVELRRQMWQIKRRELELIAARNFTLPRLDSVALYRWRGLGDDLTGASGGRFASAYKDLGSGDHQEWQLGFELQVPIGQRQAWAGVRNAQLQVARARAILREQEMAISHTLSDAISEVIRAHTAVRTNFDRLNAAVQRRDAASAAYQGDQVTLDVVLDAQQRLSDAQTVYFQSLAQHSKAIKNVQLQKGSLLEYNGVHLSEGGWPAAAYCDASQLRSRWHRRRIDYRFTSPANVSRGAYQQRFPEMAPPPPQRVPLPESSPLPPLQEFPPASAGAEVSPLPPVAERAERPAVAESSPRPAVAESSPLPWAAEDSRLPAEPESSPLPWAAEEATSPIAVERSSLPAAVENSLPLPGSSPLPPAPAASPLPPHASSLLPAPDFSPLPPARESSPPAPAASALPHASSLLPAPDFSPLPPARESSPPAPAASPPPEYSTWLDYSPLLPATRKSPGSPQTGRNAP